MDETCIPAICRERVKYCDGRLEDTRKLFLNQVVSVEKSISNAKDDMERRLAAMNEFRTQLEKQADNFLDRGYYEIQHKMLVDKLENLKQWRDIQEGKASWTNLLAVLAIAVSVIFGILHFLTGLK